MEIKNKKMIVDYINSYDCCCDVYCEDECNGPENTVRCCACCKYGKFVIGDDGKRGFFCSEMKQLVCSMRSCSLTDILIIPYVI